MTSKTAELTAKLIVQRLSQCAQIHPQKESGLTFTAGADSKPQPIIHDDYAEKSKKKKPCGLTARVTRLGWERGFAVETGFRRSQENA